LIRGNTPSVGQIVQIVRGRDQGMFAVVVGYQADRFLLLADGHRRKADKPKKKNVAHVRATSYFAEEIVQAAAKASKITNAKLRYALRQLDVAKATVSEGIEEGGISNGQG